MSDFLTVVKSEERKVIKGEKRTKGIEDFLEELKYTLKAANRVIYAAEEKNQ